MAAPCTLSDAERAVRKQAVVTLPEAARFLGFQDRTDIAYRMAERYRRRIAKVQKDRAVLDAATIMPRRNKDGGWAEIANVKLSGVIRCRSDLLLAMVYPEGAGQ